MKKDEMKLYNGTTAMFDITKMMDSIRTVCQKVEKATDSYKNIMEEVAILHLNKVHAKSGLSFTQYMFNETGMGETTCKSLVAIQKHIEYECGRLETIENLSNDDIAEYRGFMKKATMRELLLMAKNQDITTEYVVLHAANIYLNSKKKDRAFQELLEESLELAKDKYVKLRHASIEEKKVVDMESEESEPEDEISEESPDIDSDTFTAKYHIVDMKFLKNSFAEIEEIYGNGEPHGKITIVW